jgi:hypothetical protein
MSPRIIVLLVFVLVLGALFLMLMAVARRSKKSTTDPNQRTLEVMRQVGGDPTQAHDVCFYLYFADEAAARRAAELLGAAYESEVKAPREGIPDWALLAHKSLLPSESAIEAETSRMEEIAEELGGEFDGWEVRVDP